MCPNKNLYARIHKLVTIPFTFIWLFFIYCDIFVFTFIILFYYFYIWSTSWLCICQKKSTAYAAAAHNVNYHWIIFSKFDDNNKHKNQINEHVQVQKKNSMNVRYIKNYKNLNKKIVCYILILALVNTVDPPSPTPGCNYWIVWYFHE